MKTPIQDIARICHEANRTLCATQGDYTQMPWETAPKWQQDSAIAGVTAHINSGLTMMPSDSHQSWMAQKLEDGWKYGPVKDADKKEHPCMVPYEQLPREQQLKDYLFRSIVHGLAGEK